MTMVCSSLIPDATAPGRHGVCRSTARAEKDNFACAQICTLTLNAGCVYNSWILDFGRPDRALEQPMPSSLSVS